MLSMWKIIFFYFGKLLRGLWPGKLKFSQGTPAKDKDNMSLCKSQL
jgi:hypothetical protein